MSEVPGQNLLSQLLGIDPQQNKRQSAQGQSGMPSAAAAVKAMQGVKLSSALKGLNITSNFMWLVLFVGFFLWLFVVYWIRHNEPFANHVLGPGASHSATGHDDRRLMENMRDALPVKISKDTGFVYVPGKPDISTFGSPVGRTAPAPVATYASHGAQAEAHTAGTVVNAPAIHPQMAHSQQFPASSAYPHPAAIPYVPPTPLTGAPERIAGYGAAYLVPHKTPEGSHRVKMIVNR